MVSVQCQPRVEKGEVHGLVKPQAGDLEVLGKRLEGQRTLSEVDRAS